MTKKRRRNILENAISHDSTVEIGAIDSHGTVSPGGPEKTAKHDAQVHRIESSLTSKRHEFIYRNQQKAPHTLFEALQINFPNFDKNNWGKRIAQGGAYINGHPALVDSILPAVPFRIEYYEPKAGAHEKLFKRLEKEWIVYEDKELIAINKPAGLACIQAREQHSSHLRKLVEDYLGKQAHLPSRLDTSARGLVVISTAGPTHKMLQQVYERHEVEKYYLLAVSPVVKWNSKLVQNRLDRDPRHAILRKVVETGGDEAITFFSKVSDTVLDGVPCSIILAKPRTGRTHQLRVQLAALGSPVVGDNFYAGVCSSELHLLSLKIKFFDKRSKTAREFKLRECDMPSWAKYEWVV